jgi:hypothetical protein
MTVDEEDTITSIALFVVASIHSRQPTYHALRFLIYWLVGLIRILEISHVDGPKIERCWQGSL